MTTKTRAQQREASRISTLKRAYRRHSAAIQQALEMRAMAQRANIPVITTVAPDGTLYKIATGPRGYTVLAVEQGSRAS